jgi:hypothetical protein
MNITPLEAEEALAAIQAISQKTRRAIANSGAYLFLIAWGIVWLLGFSASQFLAQEVAGYAWIALDSLGGLASAVIGFRMSNNIRSATPITSGKRIAVFWLLLFLYCIVAIAIAWPVNGKQISMFIILFVMVGWMAMGLLLSFGSFWFGLILTALALVGYFGFPGIYYLWMAILGGGGMIALGLYIRYRW